MRQQDEHKEINFFLINNKYYFVDLPGYGYARGSMSQRDLITERIEGYLFNSDIAHHAVVLIIDANVGMTESDLSMFQELAQQDARVIIVANKIDKLNQSDKQKNITLIKQYAGQYPVVLFSSTKRPASTNSSHLSLHNKSICFQFSNTIFSLSSQKHFFVIHIQVLLLLQDSKIQDRD